MFCNKTTEEVNKTMKKKSKCKAKMLLSVRLHLPLVCVFVKFPAI